MPSPRLKAVPQADGVSSEMRTLPSLSLEASEPVWCGKKPGSERNDPRVQHRRRKAAVWFVIEGPSHNLHGY
ncbi:hypothetical protein HDU83_009982, partial [Entophlyctis luteolus]